MNTQVTEVNAQSIHEYHSHIEKQKFWLIRLYNYLSLGHVDATCCELAEWRSQFVWEDYKNDLVSHCEILQGEISRGMAQTLEIFPELEAEGLVSSTRRRACKVSGLPSGAWQLTELGTIAAGGYVHQ